MNYFAKVDVSGSAFYRLFNFSAASANTYRRDGNFRYNISAASSSNPVSDLIS